ncbi:hypothetical protein [Nocardioides yefusunii]|uniref:Uncharacterized protein n=1 Tax=Nocardioides yefusunii TaxID=2500546 RepID=A0ABW1QX55_9ACTN|nr:hypothetical protein [Nocardioides yefusunii]
MNRTRTVVASVAASTLLAGSVMALSAAPAQADGPERSTEFWIGNSEVDFSVERERNKFEVDVDIDDAKPGSKWRVVLRHDGKIVHKKTHRADRGGDVEVTKYLKNTSGKDTFRLTVTKVGTGKAHVRTLTLS